MDNIRLLKIDIFQRLPYGLFVMNERISDEPIIYTEDYHPYVESCKPYLRPMSSMTESERDELYNLTHKGSDEWTFSRNAYIVLDWMNEKGFDYRGLIEKGIALPAKKEMYMKKAEVNFDYEGGQSWKVSVMDRRTDEVLHSSIEEFGIPGKLTEDEKMDCMRMSIGGLINSKGYYF
jgi:hypothetical protein